MKDFSLMNELLKEGPAQTDEQVDEEVVNEAAHHAPSFDEIQSLETSALEYLRKGQKIQGREKTGLDDRVGVLYMGDDWVGTEDGKRLDYYGGFEYIKDKEYLQVGRVKFYSSENHRVQNVIDIANGETDEDVEERGHRRGRLGPTVGDDE